MHYVTHVEHLEGYKLLVTFENNITKIVDLENHIGKGVFTPLKDLNFFKSVYVNPDLDTIAWENGVDISPDFLFEIGVDATKTNKGFEIQSQ